MKTKETEEMLSLVLQRLEEYHRDVKMAIEAVTNAPHELLTTE